MGIKIIEVDSEEGEKIVKEFLRQALDNILPKAGVGVSAQSGALTIGLGDGAKKTIPAPMAK